MKKDFSFNIFKSEGHIKNPLRYYRQAEDLASISITNLNKKGISDEEFFINSLNYEIASSLKIYYFYLLTKEEEIPDITIFLIVRRLIELFAILNLYKEKLFLPLNYRLFKLQALKKIGTNEKNKISKQLHVKVETLENMLSDYTPIYLFGIVEDYSHYRNIVLKALGDLASSYYDVLGIFIHQASLICLDYNSKLKDGFIKSSMDLTKQFSFVLSDIKKLPNLEKKNNIKFEKVHFKVFSFELKLDELYHLNIAFMFDESNLMEDLFNFIQISLRIFINFYEEGFKKYIVNYFKYMFERIALYDYLISNVKGEETVLNFKTYSFFSYMSICYAYSGKSDLVYENFYSLKDELLEEYKNKYKKSKNFLYTKMITSPQYAIYLKDQTFTEAVLTMLNKYFEKDENIISSYLSIYKNGVDLSHASMFLAFMDIEDIDKQIEDGFLLFTKFVNNVFNYFVDDNSYFVNNSNLKGRIEENDEITKLRLKIITLRSEFNELSKMINAFYKNEEF